MYYLLIFIFQRQVLVYAVIVFLSVLITVYDKFRIFAKYFLEILAAFLIEIVRFLEIVCVKANLGDDIQSVDYTGNYFEDILKLVISGSRYI
jgi:hypothetical protein